jgi:Fibronectin type III domain
MSSFQPCTFFVSLIFAFALASPAGAATLTLAWDPPEDGEVNGYIVLYGTSSGVYSSRIDVGDVTTIPVSGLAGSTKYFFAVQAYDESGALSEPSNEVSGTTPVGTSNPTNPTPGVTVPPNGTTSDGVTGIVRTNRYIDLAWLPPPGEPDRYRVEIGTSYGETSFSALTRDHSIAFDMTDLPAPAYFIRIRPLYGDRYGYPSEELVLAPSGAVPTPDPAAAPDSRVQCVAAPNAPRKFSSKVEGAAVTLTWQPGAGAPAAGYVLQVGSAPGLQNILTANFEATDVGVKATASDAAYAVRLAATNTCGSSLWESERIVYVGVEPLPGAPPALTQHVSGNLVSLAWTAPTSGGRVTRYLIEAATPVGPFVYDTARSDRAFSNANTPPGQYIVTVRAGNATGFGPASPPVRVVVQ